MDKNLYEMITLFLYCLLVCLFLKDIIVSIRTRVSAPLSVHGQGPFPSQ